MRKRLAKWMALLTGVLICNLAVLFAMVQNQPASSDRIGEPGSGVYPGLHQIPSSEISPAYIDVAMGRTVYDLLRCRNCHSIRGEGNRRHPLDDAGLRLTEEEIRQWILAPYEIDPSIRKPDYNFLSPEQISCLVKYIQSL